MNLRFRPIDQWPAGKLLTDDQREYSRFSATWRDTLQILEREISNLGANELVLQVAADERAMRLDGGLRADAKPTHPGVIVSFETRKYGPLRYFTDRFKGSGYGGYLNGWQSNVRAIALGLEALRKVERYGIANRGEQYTGWKQLGSGIEVGPAGAPMTVDEAARLLCDATMDEIGEDPSDVGRVASVANSLWREAAKLHHPDAGGDPEAFRRLTQARDVLLRFAS